MTPDTLAASDSCGLDIRDPCEAARLRPRNTAKTHLIARMTHYFSLFPSCDLYITSLDNEQVVATQQSRGLVRKEEKEVEKEKEEEEEEYKEKKNSHKPKLETKA